VFHDVAPLWHELERRRTIVGIASNFDARLLALCRALPPLDRAKHIFPSSVVGFAKPCREYFQRVQQKLAVQPHEILLVGDDPVADYAGAIAAGWQAVLLDRKHQASETPRISELTQLIELLPNPTAL
jgi:putative hydrolase of the HAD superfamily